MSDNSSIFVKLGGSHPNENYLSRLFVACFVESPEFAQCMLGEFWRACRLGAKVPEAKRYVCVYQPPTPERDGSHPDLCLRPVKAGLRPIYIESKVESHLGEAQLLRYKNSGVKSLVAVTKNWPEVPLARLRKLEINTLRWQDICRSLTNARITGVKQSFLRGAFIEYLESRKMAYREDISASRLEKLSTVLAKISSQKIASCVPKQSFEIADSCIAMLDDVIRLAREAEPRLDAWTTWGPGYFKNPDKETNVTKWNALGFEFFRKGKYAKFKILCAIYFVLSDKNEADSVVWGVGAYGSDVKLERDREQPVAKFMHEDKLDPNKLAKYVLTAVREWKVQL
jgi:hypothetical protein